MKTEKQPSPRSAKFTSETQTNPDHSARQQKRVKNCEVPPAANIRQPAYYEYSPTDEQTKPPTEEERHGAHPPRRPKDRDTSDPETKFNTRYAHYQRHTVIRPYATINQGEPHTNRDVNLVPDRGKEPNEAAIAEIEHEKPPPKLSDSCTYKL